MGIEILKKKHDNLSPNIQDEINKLSLAAVKERGRSLQFMPNKTKDICMAAVENDGTALEFVEEQTEEICISAVKENKDSLKYVNHEFLKKCREVCNL